MEKELTKIYDEAYGDLAKKWDSYMKEFEPKLKQAYDDLQKAIASGDKGEIQHMKNRYVGLAKEVTVSNQRFQEVAEDMAQRISHVNETALAYVNGKMPEIYALNYNAFGNEKIAGYSFSLVNENAVKELATIDKLLLPYKQLDKAKDVAWNVKAINSQMMQGILIGESIPDLAQRLLNVTTMDEASAIRNARTMTTSAENKGRQDSYEKAQSDGVVMVREWIATGDDRTRDWHRDLDGVEVGVDEPWTNTLPDGTEDSLMYPGDPDGDPANIYNCRCAMRVHVKGFNWNKAQEEESEEAEVAENLTPTLQGLSKPERPSRSDFDDMDDFYEARENYKKEKEEYNAKIDEWVIKSLPSEMEQGVFSKWCDEHDVKIYGDISSVDGRALTAYTERMDKLFRDFPEVKDYRKLFDIPDEFKQYEFGFERTLDFIAEANHGFTFGSAGTDMVDLLKQQADAVASGFRTIGDGTINQLFDHEFGHNVYNWMQHLEDRSDAGFQRRMELRDDLIKSLYGKDGSSEYSTTNPDELFAEAFSAWYGGEKTDFANAMGDFLKRWDAI